MEERQTLMYLLIFVAIFASAVHCRSLERPFYIECVSSSECGKGQCCTIGTGRFSIPTCRSVLDKGETCRPTTKKLSVSMNVTYPDGMTLAFQDIYHNICPCASNLRCSFESGICEDLADLDYNKIDNY